MTTVCGQDDDILCIQLSQSSSGGDRRRGNTQFPRCFRSHGTPGPSLPLDDRPNVPPPPDPGDLAGKYGARAVSQVIPCGSNSADGPSPHRASAVSQVIPRGSNSADGQNPHRAILPWARYYRIDPLDLNQNARWKDPLLATPVIMPD